MIKLPRIEDERVLLDRVPPDREHEEKKRHEDETLQLNAVAAHAVNEIHCDVVTGQCHQRHKGTLSRDDLKQRVLDADNGQHTGQEEVLRVEHNVEEEPRTGRTQEPHAIIFEDEGELTGFRKHWALGIILYGSALFLSNFGPNTSTFVMPTEIFPTPIRSTCHGFSAARGKVGAAIGSFGFSIWVENPSFGYNGAFYTFAAITLVSIPLTYFCMFDNEQGMNEMDAEFYRKLNGADAITRDSFSQIAEPQTDVERAYKGVRPPM